MGLRDATITLVRAHDATSILQPLQGTLLSELLEYILGLYWVYFILIFRISYLGLPPPILYFVSADCESSH